jgi:hypothetical protein
MIFLHHFFNCKRYIFIFRRCFFADVYLHGNAKNVEEKENSRFVWDHVVCVCQVTATFRTPPERAGGGGRGGWNWQHNTNVQINETNKL